MTRTGPGETHTICSQFQFHFRNVLRSILFFSDAGPRWSSAALISLSNSISLKPCSSHLHPDTVSINKFYQLPCTVSEHHVLLTLLFLSAPHWSFPNVFCHSLLSSTSFPAVLPTPSLPSNWHLVTILSVPYFSWTPFSRLTVTRDHPSQLTSPRPSPQAPLHWLKARFFRFFI